MMTVLKVLLIILLILIVIFTILYFLGRKMQKKQAEQQATMDAVAQNLSLYIIDKARLKPAEANLPKIVVDSIPKYMRRFKLPIAKVKAGPRIMSLICDEQVFAQILPKQEVKATVSGIYITSAKRIRGPVPEPKKKKKFFDRFRKKNAESADPKKAANGKDKKEQKSDSKKQTNSKKNK
ncbi:MAG: hypothetical protein OSJ62_16550 [Lachnospiraceae bacterium]|nr:hypothetical protein [Lachnospiraceae bacterium]